MHLLHHTVILCLGQFKKSFKRFWTKAIIQTQLKLFCAQNYLNVSGNNVFRNLLPQMTSTTTDLFRYSPGAGGGGHDDESDWSNDDTDDASDDLEDDSPKRIGTSAAAPKRPYTEIKEQMYQVEA